MDSNLLSVLVCPVCKGKLTHLREQQQLVCEAEKLSYPIKDGIPIMLQDEATPLPVANS